MNELSTRGTLTLSSAEVCDRGKIREENQDNVRSARIPLGELLIVADGIGGYQGGATASRMVVEGFFSQLAARGADSPPEQAIQQACTFTNASIFNAAGSSDGTLQRMGSTVVLALIQLGSAANTEPTAWIGHVGDSRAYLIRNGKMQKVTQDHSAVQSLISRNLITEEEARNHPDASVLTRSLGHRPEVEIEIDRVSLQPGDCLLLCSDGLWGYVPDADIAAVATDGNLSVQTIADALLHQALAAGGQDNIGIEFLRLSGGALRLADAPLPATSSEPRQTSHRKQQYLAIALLLLGGCGYLGYVAISRNWFNINGMFHKQTRPSNLGGSHGSGPPSDNARTPDRSAGSHPRHDRAVTPAMNPAESKPATPAHLGPMKKIAVVGDLKAGQQEVGVPAGMEDWKRVPVTRDANAACVSHSKDKSMIYAQPNINMVEALRVVADLKLGANGVEQHVMTPEIRKDCGDYEAVVFLPNKRGGAPTEEAPGTQTPGTPTPGDSQPSHPRQQDSQAAASQPTHPARLR